MEFSEDKITPLMCSDGVERDIHIWSPEQPKAIMLVIHGALSHAGDFVLPALYFKQRQWATIGIDQCGHDRKKRIFIPSFDCFLDDLDLLIEWIKDHYPGLPIMIMAHSMGGLVAAHYGLKKTPLDNAIKGFVISAPYWGSALNTPKIVVLLAGLLAFLFPRMKAPLEDFTEQLTHDREITERIIKDRANDIRASEVTMKFGNELFKAQKYLPDNIEHWSHPLLVLIAGQDYLADSDITREYIAKMDQNLVTQHYFPQNYHENFNETNRDEIFALIDTWAARLVET